MNQRPLDSLNQYQLGIDSLSMDSLLMKSTDSLPELTYQHFFTTHKVQDVSLPMVERPKVLAESLWKNH